MRFDGEGPSAMIDDAISDDKTIAGGKGAILAGRYRILRVAWARRQRK